MLMRDIPRGSIVRKYGHAAGEAAQDVLAVRTYIHIQGGYF